MIRAMKTAETQLKLYADMISENNVQIDKTYLKRLLLTIKSNLHTMKIFTESRNDYRNITHSTNAARNHGTIRKTSNP